MAWASISVAAFVVVSVVGTSATTISRVEHRLGDWYPWVMAAARLAWVPFAWLAVLARPQGTPRRDDTDPGAPAQPDASTKPAEGDRREHARRIRVLLDACERLDVVFQPVIDLTTRRPVAYEALARFDTDPYLPPHHWFVEAHRLGLGVEVELLALRRAVERITELPDGVGLSINVSARTLQDDAFLDLVRSTDAHDLLLELTEHALVDDYELLNERLVPIRRGGTQLAVDDAGAGFASLTHILNLGPDVIKLDRQLTASIDLDANRRAMVTSLVAFAAETGALIIAEGIERDEELDTLMSVRVRYGQGYLLGRPGPLPATIPAPPASGDG